jgi:uncharacterized RDD family membrane protein YckC
MSEMSPLLDQNMAEGAFKGNVEASMASAGQRFGNFIIDLIVYYAILFGFGMVMGAVGAADGFLVSSDSGVVGLYAFIYSVHLMYYSVFEAAFGKSVGKFITQTTVVTENGEKPSFVNILGRNLCRFIPFEAFSFLGSKASGWHDSISKTRVVQDKLFNQSI